MVRAVACVLSLLGLAAVARDASANGRPPATSTISFRQGQDSEVAVGLTFGLLISRDGGKTWAWMCEGAVGYSGMYDPDYVFTASGALFGSTFDGLKVMRNSCTFDRTPQGSTFVSTAVQSPDQSVYYAASQAADPPHGLVADFKIHRSTDDGATFPTMGQPTADVNWWQSLEVAPSNPARLYLAGYRYVPVVPAGTMKVPLLFRSDNSGTDWTPLPVTSFTFAPNSVIDVVGIGKDNPDLVYVRVDVDDNAISDSIYRSTDKGATWTLINHKPVSIDGFLVRYNGDLLAATQTMGTEISHDNGDHWTPLVDPPHINCLAENAAHEVWACTQNYGFSQVPSDDAGIMKTTDLVTWTKVLRYQDLKEAVTCGPGTLQKEMCAPMWCAVCKQLGCVPSAAYNCPVEAEAPAPPAKGGCCQSNAGASALLGLPVLALLLRRRYGRRVVRSSR